MLRNALCLLLAAFAIPAAAQQRAPELQALDDALPGTLINDPYTFDWESYGDELRMRRAKAPEIPGQYAIRFTVARKGAQLYDAGSNAPITGAIAAADTIRLAMWARTITADTDDGLGRIAVRVNRDGGDYAGFGDQMLSVGAGWKLYELNAVSTLDLAAGEAVVGIQLAGAKQTVEIGQLYVMNLGTQAAAPVPAAPPQAPAALSEADIAAHEAALSALRTKLPVAGRLMNAPVIADWQVVGDPGAVSMVDASAVIGGKALSVTVRDRMPNAWDVAVEMPLTAAMRKGDTILMAYQVRAAGADNEAGSGLVSNGKVQQASAPYDLIADSSAPVGAEWTTLYASGRANRDYAAGETAISLQIGGTRQVLEIGHAYVLNLGQDIDPASLPALKVDYPGRAGDAPWRAEAAARIERVRKGDLSIRVVDAAGNPVSGTVVDISMQRHAFHFGSFVGHEFAEKSEQSALLRETFPVAFDFATAPVYWQDWGWQDAGMRAGYERIMASLAKSDIPWRGHTLIYPAENRVPSALAALAGDRTGFRQWVMDHVAEVSAIAASAKPAAFDVINEPRDGDFTVDRLGIAGIADAFRVAKAAMPDTDLYVNDYAIISAGGRNDGNIAFYHDFIRDLKAEGAPIGGIGIQGHFGAQLTDPARVIAILDDFAQHGLPIQITEFDVDTSDEEAQADYTRDMLTAAFSHPSVNGFVTWGWWEGDHWRPSAAMLRTDWSPKPNFLAWRQLLFGDWWTDETLTTGADGRVSLRGFLGEYCVEAGGAKQCFALDKDGHDAVLTLTSS
ncbi:MAG: endo-1,4-beta-xylanase [Pacificimonas sp.]